LVGKIAAVIENIRVQREILANTNNQVDIGINASDDNIAEFN
jgi:hypothetical protein